MSESHDPSVLRLHRVYAAPVAAVWAAWADPAQVAVWWGPRGFTITHHHKDLRPGGEWRYTMHGPDGKDYPNITKYHEVEPHVRLVYDHGATADSPPLFRVTVTFTPEGEGTRLDFAMRFATAEVAQQSAVFIKKAGGESTWDRLGEYLDDAQGRRRFHINRSFDVPIARMYAAWTTPEQLGAWLAPAGATVEFMRADIRPGGSSFYVMRSAHGAMYGRVDYLELDPPRRVVYAQQFCDENEQLSRHPAAPTWPATMRTVVTFTSEGPNRTRVTLQWEPQDAAANEVETFVNARAGMTQGWTGSFDKLEEALAGG